MMAQNNPNNRVDPSNPEHWYYEGKFILETQSTIAYYEEGLKRGPEFHPWAWLGIGDGRRKAWGLTGNGVRGTGQPDTVLEAYGKATALPEAWRKIGEIYEITNCVPDAVEAYAKVLVAVPADAELRVHVDFLQGKELERALREYYVHTWGFDPITDRRMPEAAANPSDLKYYYEAEVPLENDPELVAAEVSVYAREEVWIGGECHNRIVFSRGQQKASVECAHTIVYSAPAGEVASLSEKEYRNLLAATERTPALLPPWEHFAALKSFAAGLISAGVLALFQYPAGPGNPTEDGVPLSVNPEMHQQLGRCLSELVPDILQQLAGEFLVNLLDRVPAQWVIDRWDLLEGYNFRALFTNEAFLQSLDTPARDKLLEIYLDAYDTDERLETRRAAWQFLRAILTQEFVSTLDDFTLIKVIAILLSIPNGKSTDIHLNDLTRRLVLHGILQRNEIFLEPEYFDYLLYHIPLGFVELESFRGADPIFLRKVFSMLSDEWDCLPSFKDDGDFPGSILYYLLSVEGDTPENEMCLKQALNAVSREKETAFFDKLARDFDFIPAFLAREGKIDEDSFTEEQDAEESFGDDDDDETY